MRPMLPTKGRPVGPGIVIEAVEFVFLIQYFPQAGPPGKAQWRRELASHARMARMAMEKRVSAIEDDEEEGDDGPFKMFGDRVKGWIHHLSTEVSMIGKAKESLDMEEFGAEFLRERSSGGSSYL